MTWQFVQADGSFVRYETTFDAYAMYPPSPAMAPQAMNKNSLHLSDSCWNGFFKLFWLLLARGQAEGKRSQKTRDAKESCWREVQFGQDLLFEAGSGAQARGRGTSTLHRRWYFLQ